MSNYDDIYDGIEAWEEAQHEAAVRIRRGNREELVEPMAWEDDTHEWQRLQGELRKVILRLSAIDAPPKRGEAWDRLVADYVEARRLTEALTTEAIGIDLEYGGARPTQLGRDTELAQSWISLQKKRWQERRHRGNPSNQGE